MTIDVENFSNRRATMSAGTTVQAYQACKGRIDAATKELKTAIKSKQRCLHNSNRTLRWKTVSVAGYYPATLILC